MNNKKFFLSWLAVYITIFVCDGIFHGKILSGLYEQTAQMWRPKAEMNQFLPWMMLGTLVWSGAFSYLFLTGCYGKGPGAGMRFGVLIGLLFAAHNSIMYAVAPYPASLSMSWAVGGIIESGIAGAVLGLINKPT